MQGGFWRTNRHGGRFFVDTTKERSKIKNKVKRLRMSKQEHAEVTSAINNDSVIQKLGKSGQKNLIKCYGNYKYRFEFVEFNEYNIYNKEKIR